ncbi:MAG: AI-2E family transporter [Clostridiales bacterium]|nr:AI-2E family transporter [Clostridiales bacterium]
MKLTWKTCIRAGVTVVAVYLACTYWKALTHAVGVALSAASPLIIGAVIAYVANILMSFYEAHFFVKSKKPIVKKLRRPACMALAFLTAVVAIVWLLTTVLPELARCVEMIVAALPGAISKAYAWLDERFQLGEFLAEMNLSLPGADFDWKAAITSAVSFVLTGVGGAAKAAVTAVSSVFSTVVTMFLAVVFAVYLLAGKENLAARFTRLMRTYLGEKVTTRTLYILRVLDDSFHSFIVGQCTEALILGALCFIGMMIFGFSNALTISVMVGFTALIPIAGAYIAAVAGAFMLFVESPLSALLFLLFLVVLQQIEGNLIFPRVVGESIGLPGVWVLAAVTVGGGVMGIPGMLIGVPLASAAYRLIDRDLRAKEMGKSLFDMPHEVRRKNVLFK